MSLNEESIGLPLELNVCALPSTGVERTNDVRICTASVEPYAVVKHP